MQRQLRINALGYIFPDAQVVFPRRQLEERYLPTLLPFRPPGCYPFYPVTYLVAGCEDGCPDTEVYFLEIMGKRNARRIRRQLVQPRIVGIAYPAERGHG